ncbi:MAG: DUF3604 domain-containing protein [Proteobacteria bacterium]|nr:DUF3604 domain-containing protein [Pseudomonadota bacterium]
MRERKPGRALDAPGVSSRTRRSRLLSSVRALSIPLLASEVRAEGPCSERDARLNLYWGDLHVHSSYSFDPSSRDVRATPANAYRFAQGGALPLAAVPGRDSSGSRSSRVGWDPEARSIRASTTWRPVRTRPTAST